MHMEHNLIYFILISYFIGSIPFAYILTKIFGYGDIRTIGSGNVGATNVLRTGKKSLALTVLFLDVIKGFLPLTLYSFFYANNFTTNEIIFFSSFTIVGHIFPIWLNFKGGKGVATYLGFVLGINYILGIVFILSWLFIVLIKRYSSLASISSLLSVLMISYVLSHNIAIINILLLLSLIIIFKHFSNIKRLLNKTESKIKF